MSSSHKGVILHKKAGQVIPDQTLEQVLAKYPSCVGVAFAQDGQIQLNRTAETITVDEINTELQTPLKDNDLFMYFGILPESYMQDDLQPLVVLSNDKDEAELIAFIDGDFHGFEQPKSQHSNAFFLNNELLIPKLKKFYRMVDGNISRLLAELKEPDVVREFELNIREYGNITLLGASGQSASIVKGERVKAPWGWSSEELTEQEPEKKEEEPVVAKKFGFTNKYAKSVDTKKTAVPVVAKQTSTAPVADTSVKALETTPLAEGYTREDGVLYYQCPADVKDFKSIKRNYHQFAGFCPSDKTWKHRPKVKVNIGSNTLKDKASVIKMASVKTFADLGEAMKQAHEVPAEEPKKEEPVKTAPVKTAPPAAPAPAPTPAPAQNTGPVPVISASMKSDLGKFFAQASVRKVLDAHSIEAPDPKLVGKLQEKYPSFVEVTDGITDIRQLFFVPYSMKLELVKSFPEAATVLLLNLCTELADHMQMVEELMEKDGESPAEEVVETKEVEVHTPPAKKSPLRMPAKRVA